MTNEQLGILLRLYRDMLRLAMVQVEEEFNSCGNVHERLPEPGSIAQQKGTKPPQGIFKGMSRLYHFDNQISSSISELGGNR